MKVHGCGMPRTTTHCRSKLVLQENPSRFPDVDFKTKDSALFKLEEQSLSDWSTFCVAVGAVLSVVYFAWLSPSGFNLGNKFIESLEQLAGGSSSITMSIMYLVFATVHSGLAGMRQYAETVVGARAWRYVFALFSLPLALSCILYFINHR